MSMLHVLVGTGGCLVLFGQKRKKKHTRPLAKATAIYRYEMATIYIYICSLIHKLAKSAHTNQQAP